MSKVVKLGTKALTKLIEQSIHEAKKPLSKTKAKKPVAKSKPEVKPEVNLAPYISSRFLEVFEQKVSRVVGSKEIRAQHKMYGSLNNEVSNIAQEAKLALEKFIEKGVEKYIDVLLEEIEEAEAEEEENELEDEEEERWSRGMRW